MNSINDYAKIVGQAVLDDLKIAAEKLKGKRITHVNSTPVGGGVAEILTRMVPLLNQLGVQSDWQVIKGNNSFFDVTKKMHNNIHGSGEPLTESEIKTFMENGAFNEENMPCDSDIMFIHDPQPITLINKKRDNKWIWRCHVDASNPVASTWKFLREFIDRYDSAVFSSPLFARQLPIRQFLISPSIDPLSDKNRDMEPEEIKKYLDKYNIPTDKPLITQISRFDRLKDPVGVIQAYKKVKPYVDCRLLLAGGTAVDDPEGNVVYNEVLEAAGKDKDIMILNMPQDDNAVNAIQRASTVIMQKSLKEGFGLTVSEALWKSKPVVASHVGGIPLQIKHKYSGMLCHSIDGAAFALKMLLNNPDFADKLGKNGKEHVRNNFLLTRHIKEYMLLFLSLYSKEDVVLF
ncbi:MAG: glycosyltransferase [Candidatus Goldbacteria bacterium]|nr:glycosyltransferase [Candidatus Goldiibacteriota bacterium]